MNIFGFIDDLLNTFTMYRVVLYGLCVIALFTILFGFLELLPYSGLSLTFSFLIVATVCFAANKAFSYFLHAPVNSESWLITAIILYLIVTPLDGLTGGIVLALSGAIAMASKYVIAINKKHIFNPAAFAAFILSIFHQDAIRWVGSTVLTPIVLFIGFLIVRKTQKFNLLFSFLLVSLTTIFVMSLLNNTGGITLLWQAITSWPILFLGTVMLTEPFTMPPTKKMQMFYGSFVGFIMASQIHVGAITVSPEIALLIGNIYAYFVNSKTKLFLHLKSKVSVAPNIVNFSFVNTQKFAFSPGQYMEWTLAHPNTDMRGNRRYFTIASSPTENDIMVGVRISKQSSSYKKKLDELQSSDLVVASSVAGDFVLPANKTKKLVFLSGGIGVTPFRSMIKYLIDTNERRDITILHTAKNQNEFAYKEVFDEAHIKLGMHVVYTITNKENVPLHWRGSVGRIDENLIKNEINDYQERIFYISGPRAMVVSLTNVLKSVGIPNSQIKTDFFPGYV